jgi:hypothetical protein
MAESGRPRDDLEGWGVRWRWAIAIAVAFFGFVAASVGGIYAFYAAEGAPHVDTRPGEIFPAPRPNAKLDDAPGWSFAPSHGLEEPPDPAVSRAMSELAAKGDAGYAPLQERRP